MKTLILSESDATLMAQVIRQGMNHGFQFPPNSPTKTLFEYWIAFLQGELKTSTSRLTCTMPFKMKRRPNSYKSAASSRSCV